MELIKRWEYYDKKNVWFEIPKTDLFLDECKETLYVFLSPKDNENFNVELNGENEDCGEIFDMVEVGNVEEIKDILKEL